MSMVKYLLPQLALPLGEGVTPFVSADSFMGGAVKGVHLRNIANRHPGQLQVGITGTHGYSNQVHYLNTPAPTGNDHYFGYWFENCDNLTVDNNLAFSNTMPLGAGIDKRLRGFSVDNTTNSNFCSNKAEQMGSGVWVYNKCAGTQFHGTTNNSCFHGFHLLNADLPRQGDGINGWQNKWTGTLAHIADITGSTYSLQQLFWDYDQNDPDWIPIIYLAPNVFPVPQNTHDPDCNPPQGPRDEKRNQEFGGTVMDTISYNDFPDENKYQDKEQFYKIASDDSTFLALGVNSDIIYQNEFDSLAQTNVGKLKQVEAYLKKENYPDAASVNQTITPNNQIEENKKQLTELQLSLLASNDSMNHADSVQWNSIADHDAIQGGDAVYIARAKLNKDVIDDPVGYYRLSHPNETKSSDEASAVSGKIIPNPANSDATFYFNHSENENVVIKIHDAFNNEIANYKLSANSLAFKTSELRQAVYFIHVLVNDLEEEYHRLIIIR